MRTLALVLCFILLLVAIPLLLVVNLIQISFYWADAVSYLVVAAVIYGLIAAVAYSLNKQFTAAVNEFICGSVSDLVPRRGLQRTFGMLLVVFLPYLLYLLLFSVFIAVTFGLYGFYAVSLLPRVPIAILIGLVVVVLGTVAAFFIGMYRLFFPPRPQTFGVDVTVKEQPEVWGLAHQVAADVGTKPADRIVVTPDPGVSVHLDGSLLATLFGGGHRVLQIGVPSIHALSVDELRAILAHEYGHFSNRDTQWSTFTYAMGNGLIAAFQATPGPLKQNGEGGGWVGLVMALNPAYWTLLLFLKLFFNATSAFSRIREVMANVRAMQLYGGESFRNGLEKVVFNDALFATVVQGEVVPALAKENKTVANFSEVMGLVKRDISQKMQEQVKSSIASVEPSSYDSHPQVSIRLKYSERFSVGKAELDGREAATLFREWHGLNKKLADLYNVRLLSYLNYLRAAAARAEGQEGPVKGIIYTESEIEEFKRRGQM